MKYTAIAIFMCLAAFGMMFSVDKLDFLDLPYQPVDHSAGHSILEDGIPDVIVRAAGKLEGLTEPIELRARVREQILSIQAVKGMQVSKGQPLVSLDPVRLEQELELAKANLAFALAKKQRLENGARPSEIEAVKQEFEANMAPYLNAQRDLKRGTSLFKSKAISQQDFDQLKSRVESTRAKAAAAQARLKTLKMPPRTDDLSAANAEIQAATSRLKIAKINLDRSVIRAPIDGQVLNLNARPGDLTGPESIRPLLILVNTAQLHAVAEVDEFDALAVQVGQRCIVTSDAFEGELATGHIVEVEPQMQPKLVYGQWAGERHDTFSRRVRILLDGNFDLPIGLPIEVAIHCSK